MSKKNKANIMTSGVIPLEDGTYAVRVESCDADGVTSYWTEPFDDEETAYQYCRRIDEGGWPSLLTELGA